MFQIAYISLNTKRNTLKTKAKTAILIGKMKKARIGCGLPS